QRLGLRAQARASTEAVLARATPVRTAHAAEAEDHPIADRDVPLGAGPERFDDADALVPEAHRAGHAHPVAARAAEVGVTHARRAQVHARLVRQRLRHLDVADVQLAFF